MVSRDFISGFLMGVGISSVCYGLYLMYIGNKLKNLSRVDNSIELVHIENKENKENNMNCVD
jgi:hypothetical protein